MLGSVAHETEILTQVLALRENALEFANYAYPWGAKGTVFEKGLRKWQVEELKAISDHVLEQTFRYENGMPLRIWRSAWSSGRGPGKSGLLGILSHWQMSTRLGSTVSVMANTESQLRTKTFPEFAVWFTSAINAHWFTQETLRITPKPWLAEIVERPREQGGYGISAKYWYVQGLTWNEDNTNAVAGTHNPLGLMVVLDEAAGIAAGVWDALEGFFTEANPYRFLAAASQMRTRSGRFFEIFNDEQMGAGWRKKTLDTSQMPDCVDQAIVQDQIKRYGEDSDFVRVEIRGLPPRTSEDQFIPCDNVRAAQRNELGHDYGEPLILGIDPAPRGKTAWRFRQGRNARDCVGKDTRGSWLGKDNVQIANEILELDRKYKPDHICIDFGMGTGVIDILKRKRTHGKLHEVRFGDNAHGGKDSEWGSHAAELWSKVRDWLPGGMIEKDDGSKGTLSQQLTDRGWRWSQREDNKKILETKEDLQSRGVKSPDDADALACTFEVNPPRRPDPGESKRGGVAEGSSTGNMLD